MAVPKGDQLTTPSLPTIRKTDLADPTEWALNNVLSMIWRRIVLLSGGAGTINIPSTISAQAFTNPGQTQTPSDNSELITLGTALGLFAPGNARAAQLQGAFKTDATSVQQAQPLPQSVASSPAPKTSNSPGVPGQIAYDSGNLYICVSNNSWKRVAVASF